jgi:F-type H+-transporting ATPase subunit epsilon
MLPFKLQIVTPDGLLFEGEAGMISLRSVEGEIGIMARHIDLTTALGMGKFKVILPDESVRYAACIGGLVAVVKGAVRVVATTFEWAENINAERAENSKRLAEEVLANSQDAEERTLAGARLRRALVRLSVKE